MKRKIIILGFRSGTSLMKRCFEVMGYRSWGDNEAPVRDQIWDEFPNVDISNWSEEWDVAKLPEFKLIIPQLIEKYDPIFVWMVRNPMDILRSYNNLGWDQIIIDQIKRHPNIIQYFGWESLFDNLSMHANQIPFLWISMMFQPPIWKYPNRFLIVSFNDMMSDYSNTMIEVFENWLGMNISSDQLTMLHELRLIRWSEMSHGPLYWLGGQSQ